MRNRMELSSLQIVMDPKQLETVEFFNCLGSVIRSNAKCACEIKSGIVMAKAESAGRRLRSS